MSKRSRSRGKVVKEVVDPRNPNIIEKTYEGSLPSPSIKKTRQKNEYEDDNEMDIGDEVDDMLYGGVEFGHTSGSQGREPASSQAWRFDARNTDRATGRDPNPPGKGFLTDAETGTPLDHFDFDAMKRYLERLVKFKTSDIAIFVGGLAAHTNQREETFYENGKKPSFLDTNASSMRTLLTTAGLSLSAIIPLMTQVVLSQVGGAVKREVELGRVARDDPLPQDATPIAWDDEIIVYQSSSNQKLYAVTREEARRRGFLGTSPRETSAGTIVRAGDIPAAERGIVYSTTGGGGRGGSSLNAHIEGSIQWLGQLHVQSQDHPQLIGSNFFGRQDGDDEGNAGGESLFADMRQILSQFMRASNQDRWLWNSLPENSGIASITDSVRYIMEEAWRNIQKLPGKSDIQIYHLIHSPEVRTKFAHYVATLLNVAPGMSLAPGLVSGSGRVLGYRAGQGLIKDQRYANMGRAAYLWFKTVNYKENPKVAEARQALYSIDAEMTNVIRESIEGKRDDLMRQMDAVWETIVPSIKFWASIQFFLDERIYQIASRRRILAAAINDQTPEGDPLRTELTNAEARLAYFKDLKKDFFKPKTLEWAKAERTALAGMDADISPIEKVMMDRLKSWINILGIQRAGLEQMSKNVNVPPLGAGDDLVSAGGYWRVIKKGPQFGNWNDQDRDIYVGVPNNIPSSITGNNVDYLSATIALDNLAKDLSIALSSVTVWRDPPQELSSIRSLAYELLAGFKKLHEMRKKKLEAERFLAGLREEDKMVLTKNQAIRKSKYTSYLKLVPTADEMEGYFPTPPLMIPSSGVNWKKVPMFKQGFF